MLIAIAFLMFVVLMLAWLTMPEKDSSPMPVAEPVRRAEGDVLAAHA